jgi:hypothetical protein
MGTFFHQSAAHLSHFVVSQFLLIWLLLLALIVFCGLAATDSRRAEASAEGRRSVWPSREAEQIAGYAFAVILLGYAVLTFCKQWLADFDNDALWAILLLLVVYCVLLASNRRHPIYSRQESEPGGGKRTPFRRPRGAADWIATAALTATLLCYLLVIFYKQDFAYYDDEVFTDYSVVGKNFEPAIWPGEGRFFPLEAQEFNYLKWVTRSPAGYHSFALVELLILLAVLVMILEGYGIQQRVVLLMAVLLAPGFLISFMGLIYPERNVLFWLAILVLCVQGHAKTGSAGYFLGALVATHFALYYKEPVAVFVGVFSVARIALDWRGSRQDGGSWPAGWREIARRNSLPLGILCVTGMFVVLLVTALAPAASGHYAASHHASLAAVLRGYLRAEWLVPVMLAVFAVRAARWLFTGAELDPLWEPLAAGALGYCLAVVTLRLYSGYYAAPAEMIAVLYLGRLALQWLSRPTPGRVIAVATAYSILMLHNAAYCAFRVVETKSLIGAKEQFADFLRNQTEGMDRVEVYFPYASRFHLMGISAYLKYRGIPNRGRKGETGDAKGKIAVEGGGEYPFHRCVDYRSYQCTHADGAPNGAWIVVMPDDDVSRAEVERAGQGATLVFSVKACGICEREGSWFRRLHAISQEYWNGPLPGHWLQLHVFKKSSAVAKTGIEKTTLAGANGESSAPGRAK